MFSFFSKCICFAFQLVALPGGNFRHLFFLNRALYNTVGDSTPSRKDLDTILVHVFQMLVKEISEQVKKEWCKLRETGQSDDEMGRDALEFTLDVLDGRASTTSTPAYWVDAGVVCDDRTDRFQTIVMGALIRGSVTVSTSYLCMPGVTPPAWTCSHPQPVDIDLVGSPQTPRGVILDRDFILRQRLFYDVLLRPATNFFLF